MGRAIKGTGFCEDRSLSIGRTHHSSVHISYSFAIYTHTQRSVSIKVDWKEDVEFGCPSIAGDAFYRFYDSFIIYGMEAAECRAMIRLLQMSLFASSAAKGHHMIYNISIL